MGMTQAQKDKADARIKNTASYVAYDLARTAWENENDPAAKRTKGIAKSKLAGACGREAGIF